MFRIIFSIACLLLVSTGAIASPRSLIREGSQIDSLKEASVALSVQSNRSDATSMPNSGTHRLDAQAAPGKLADDDLAAFPAQAKAHGKAMPIASQAIRHTEFGTPLRNETDFADQEIPSQIKMVLPQPTAPPVINYRNLAPGQA